MMKKLYTFLIALLFVGGVMGQGCLPDGITFETQAQIDSFQINYPGCTEIEGNVKIGGVYGSGVTNLNGLSSLTSIAGALWISKTSLTDLDGLNNLITIESLLALIENDLLETLSGLENLESIGGLITGFTMNFVWPTFTGNPNLESIEALANLTYIGGSMSICGTSLTNLNGLENLTTVVGGIEIGRAGNGPYWNGNNPFLENIDAIRNITSIGGELSIVANDTLADCAIESICAYLSDPVDTVEIFGNNLGCNSPEEVLDSCEAHAGIIDGLSIAEKLVIYPNPAHATITIELTNITTQQKNTSLTVSNTNGQQLITQPIIKPQTEIDISHLPVGIYIIKVWNDKDVMVRKVIKQ